MQPRPVLDQIGTRDDAHQPLIGQDWDLTPAALDDHLLQRCDGVIWCQRVAALAHDLAHRRVVEAVFQRTVGIAQRQQPDDSSAFQHRIAFVSHTAQAADDRADAIPGLNGLHAVRHQRCQRDRRLDVLWQHLPQARRHRFERFAFQ